MHHLASPGFARYALVLLLAASAVVAAPTRPVNALGGNCNNASTGKVPLTDTGDLYTTGNTMPAGHASAGPAVSPIDGVVGVVSIGMSNGQQEWGEFEQQIAGRADLAGSLRFANAAQPGKTAALWANPTNGAWDSAISTVTGAGFRVDQVQVVWMKMGSRLSELGTGPFDERVALEQRWLNSALDNAAAVFPNLKQVYFSSRIYSGYSADTAILAEPMSGYDNGFAVKAVIEDAIAGATPVWAAWGPYLWADGTTPRNDGLTWECDDLEDDGVHPSGSGEAKVASLLEGFFSSEPVACQWFLADPAGCGSIGSFIDVSTTNTFYADIEWLAAAGITVGCNPPFNTKFCPNDPVTRGQMAAFLDRALNLPDGPDAFGDDETSIFEANINALAAAGVALGCNPPTNTDFCPTQNVTRGQMAAFLVRALGLPPGVEKFTDDDGSIFEADIEALAAAGITLGCNPPANTLFCPNDVVTRAQMAAFLHRSEPWL